MGRRFSDAAESHVKVSVSSNLKLSPSLWFSLEREAPRGCLDWTFAISSSSVTLFLLWFECCSSEIRVVTSVPLWLIMKWVLLCPQGWIKMEVFSLELFHHGKAQQPDPLEDTETRLREMTFPRHLVPWFGAKQRTKSMLFVSFSICDILLEQQKQLGQFLPYSSVILERQITETSWSWKTTIWLHPLWMEPLSKCLSFYVMAWDSLETLTSLIILLPTIQDCYTPTLVPCLPTPKSTSRLHWDSLQF